MDQFTSQANDVLRSRAQAAVVAEKPRLAKENPLEFIREVHKKFCEERLNDFPRLCDVARYQNYLKWQELKEIGNKGKYTDSLGWSEKREFKFDYEIPQELYLFMVNMVYADFWEEGNERIWRKFMKKVCDGGDAMETLLWVKKIYGANSQEGLVLN